MVDWFPCTVPWRQALTQETHNAPPFGSVSAMELCPSSLTHPGCAPQMASHKIRTVSPVVGFFGRRTSICPLQGCPFSSPDVSLCKNDLKTSHPV